MYRDGFIHFDVDGRKRGQSWNNFPASNPKNATWNRDGAHNGDPQIEAWNLSCNGELPVNSELSLHSFGKGGQRDTAAGNNFRRANGLATITQLLPDGYFAFNNSHEIDFQCSDKNGPGEPTTGTSSAVYGTQPYATGGGFSARSPTTSDPEEGESGGAGIA